MFIRQEGSVVRVTAPAKLNLFLEVLAKRPDGYHEIETLLVAIDRFDTLTFCPQENSRIGLTCSAASAQGGRRFGSRTAAAIDGGASELPVEEENLAYRALRLLQRRSGTPRGGSAFLIKRIPPASGLGGGSSDAAAALLAANRAWGLHWPRGRLSELAAELGSDVPFFLTPRRGAGAMLAVCRGRGERVEPVRGPAGMHFVVARPAVGLSTPAVYANCQPAQNPRSVAALLEALRSGRIGRIRESMVNRLQQAAAGIHGVVEEMADSFASLGALAHQQSGSGSAYFGWFSHAQAAARAALRLRGRGIPHVWRVRTI